MAYLALYRRFRPQGFDELIGQEHIAKILKNQINSGKIGHAYLFCGARGTGKTSVAKIFARAINCISPVNGSPCGECEVCKGLKDPSNMDILEMDAASNNGVDDIREMREKIQYPPVVGRYKVYIVDEVHMLSPAAFNALLKTLEEPPLHAVFIFATTEVHKLPQTILSRCMRFDFKLISKQELTSLIKGVFDEIGKPYEPEAVEAIATAGEGSARDALSIADTCSSYSQGKLTYKDVLEILGAADRGKVLELTSEIIKGETCGALKIIDELASLGKNMGVLAGDIAATLRDLIICATARSANDILGLPADRFAQYKAVADMCDAHRLLRLLDIFTSLDNSFRFSTHPRIVLETAAIKACSPKSDYDLDALLSRVATLERALENGAYASSVAVGTAAEIKHASNEKPKPETEVKPQEVPDNAKESTIPEDFEEEASSVLNVRNSLAAEEDPGGVVAEPEREAEPSVSIPKAEAELEELSEDDIGALPETDFFSMADGGGTFTFSDAEPAEIKNDAPDSEEQEAVPPYKVWGFILQTLRKNGNAVLWTVCREVNAVAVKGKITVTVKNKSEYEMFMKPDHLKTLGEIANKYGKYTIDIVKRSSVDSEDEWEEDVKKVKELFGEDKVIIIKD